MKSLQRMVFAMVVLAASGALVTLSSAPANADTAPVVGGAWYWREQVPRNVDNPATPLGTPAQLPAPPDVPAGDFAVAVKSADPALNSDVADDKQTFLHIDTIAIPAESEVTGFVLTLKEDSAGRAINAATASIKAYPVTGFFVDGGEAQAWADRPTFDPNLGAAEGKRAADGTWTFDLKPIVQKWVSGSVPNNGLAFAAAGIAPGSQPFQVVWSGSTPKPTTTGTFIAPSGSTDTSTTETTAVDTSFTSEPVSITPDLTTPFVAPESTVIPTPTPTPSGSGLAPRVRIIAKSHANRGIPIGFYAACLAVIALVGAGMFALGEAGEPIPARQGSVMRALERRLQEPA